MTTAKKTPAKKATKTAKQAPAPKPAPTPEADLVEQDPEWQALREAGLVKTEGDAQP